MDETQAGGAVVPNGRAHGKDRDKKRERLIKKRDWRTDVNEDGEVVILRRGEERSATGDFYLGEFLEGQKHGKGRMRFAGGNIYEGMLFAGSYRPVGQSLLSGDWAFDVFHGHGSLKFAEFVEGSRRIIGRAYKGYWKQGEMHGYGIFTKGDGETYEGEFRHNAYHGRGKQRLPSGDQYDGMFKEGQYHGRGFMRYANDSNYQGDFLAGMFHGQGTFRWPKGAGSYTGTFVKNRMDGFGKRIFSNKTVFEGEYKGGGMNGRGQLTRANGDKYEGEFMDNRFHGNGVMHYATGDSYRGQWQVGVYCGFGKYEYEAGGYYEGEYWSLCRTGVKAALDETDLQQFLSPESQLLKLLNQSSGAKQLLDPAYLRRLHKERIAARKSLAPSGVRTDLSARDRRKLYDKRRQVGAVLVGSEYDDESHGGVLRPIVDGTRHGKGVRVWASGARYEGQWWQGEMHGFGIYVGAGVEGERYEGQFNSGIREGRGIASYGHNEGGRFSDPLGNSCVSWLLVHCHKLADCNFTRLQDGGLGRSVYDGDWVGGLFHGAGTFTSADGRLYEGEVSLPPLSAIPYEIKTHAAVLARKTKWPGQVQAAGCGGTRTCEEAAEQGLVV